MKIIRIVKCKHCNKEQKRLLANGMTDEDLLWYRCEYCNKFGLYIYESERLSLKEFILEYYRHYKFRYFSKF